MWKVSRRMFVSAGLTAAAWELVLSRLHARDLQGRGELHRLVQMRVIGHAYLAQHPATMQQLDQDLRQSGLEPLSHSTLETERIIREDFRNGRTVKVNGWLLSATEAKLCALAAQV